MRVKILTNKQSNKRIKELKKKGYLTKKIKCNGYYVIMKKKKLKRKTKKRK